MGIALIIVIILLVLAAVARATGWPGDAPLLVLFAIAITLLTGAHL